MLSFFLPLLSLSSLALAQTGTSNSTGALSTGVPSASNSSSVATPDHTRCPSTLDALCTYDGEVTFCYDAADVLYSIKCGVAFIGDFSDSNTKRDLKMDFSDCQVSCDASPSCQALNYDGHSCTLFPVVSGYKPSGKGTVAAHKGLWTGIAASGGSTGSGSSLSGNTGASAGGSDESSSSFDQSTTSSSDSSVQDDESSSFSSGSSFDSTTQNGGSDSTSSDAEFGSSAGEDSFPGTIGASSTPSCSDVQCTAAGPSVPLCHDPQGQVYTIKCSMSYVGETSLVTSSVTTTITECQEVCGNTDGCLGINFYPESQACHTVSIVRGVDRQASGSIAAWRVQWAGGNPALAHGGASQFGGSNRPFGGSRGGSRGGSHRGSHRPFGGSNGPFGGANDDPSNVITTVITVTQTLNPASTTTFTYTTTIVESGDAAAFPTLVPSSSGGAAGGAAAPSGAVPTGVSNSTSNGTVIAAPLTTGLPASNATSANSTQLLDPTAAPNSTVVLPTGTAPSVNGSTNGNATAPLAPITTGPVSTNSSSNSTTPVSGGNATSTSASGSSATSTGSPLCTIDPATGCTSSRGCQDNNGQLYTVNCGQAFTGTFLPSPVTKRQVEFDPAGLLQCEGVCDSVTACVGLNYNYIFDTCDLLSAITGIITEEGSLAVYKGFWPEYSAPASANSTDPSSVGGATNGTSTNSTSPAGAISTGPAITNGTSTNGTDPASVGSPVLPGATTNGTSTNGTDPASVGSPVLPGATTNGTSTNGTDQVSVGSPVAPAAPTNGTSTNGTDPASVGSPVAPAAPTNGTSTNGTDPASVGSPVLPGATTNGTSTNGTSSSDPSLSTGSPAAPATSDPASSFPGQEVSGNAPAFGEGQGEGEGHGFGQGRPHFHGGFRGSGHGRGRVAAHGRPSMAGWADAAAGLVAPEDFDPSAQTGESSAGQDESQAQASGGRPRAGGFGGRFGGRQ
ncbi:hypothetical protein B0A50_00080 [Salinomyces thailandicus]|uniref:Apple domain-containing protein n=1 Tax=Salinomyces thailandicus TaxID=706561 RepID=A0A4U0UEY1_9PEZI|nr:hypothetical protein B0A50_00080 [Salinomyces thailandica]